MTIEDLPKYIYDEGERHWLTLTTTVQGKWNIGYADTKGRYLTKYAIGDCDTVQEAVTKLSDLVADDRGTTADVHESALSNPKSKAEGNHGA